MKKLIVILITFIIFFLTVSIYLTYENNYSDKAKKGKHNIANIKLVEKKMSINSVIMKMGHPDRIDTTVDKFIVYKYSTNDESYPFVQIYFDTNRLASKIIDYPIY